MSMPRMGVKWGVKTERNEIRLIGSSSCCVNNIFFPRDGYTLKPVSNFGKNVDVHNALDEGLMGDRKQVVNENRFIGARCCCVNNIFFPRDGYTLKPVSKIRRILLPTNTPDGG